MMNTAVHAYHPVLPIASCPSGCLALVVDDSPVNRIIAASSLKKLGFEVTTACDGYEAIQLLRERSFDVIVLDVFMPGINGLDLARMIRSKFLGCAGALILGYSTAASPAEMFEAGMDDYLPKPLKLHSMSEALGRSGRGNDVA